MRCLSYAGVAALVPAAILAPPHGALAPAALWAIGVLGIVCTALGLIVFFGLIAEAGPGRASVITYVNPLVAVVVGVLVLGERLGTMSVAGLALILVGSWLSTGSSHPSSGPS
jgi:drug/metabolite transporter (DMT)-like permease